MTSETLDMEGPVSGWVAGTIQLGAADSDTVTSEERSTGWEGETFAIRHRVCRGPRDALRCSEHKEAWGLNADRSLVITFTDLNASAEPVTTTATYRRLSRRTPLLRRGPVIEVVGHAAVLERAGSRCLQIAIQQRQLIPGGQELIKWP